MSEAPTTFPRYDANSQTTSRPSNKKRTVKPLVHSFKSMRECGLVLCGRSPSSAASNAASEDRYFCAMPYHEAIDLCLAGGAWLEGARNLQRVTVPTVGIEREIKTALLESGPVGFAPNVGAYCANLPDSMLNLEQTTAPRPVLKIEVNATLSGSTPEEWALNRGRAILAVVKALESQGVSVEVCAYVHSKQRNQAMRLEVPLKGASEALSAAKLAFATCNAAFVRRIFCRFMDTQPLFERMTNEGYGKVTDAPSGNADIHFGGLTSKNAPATPEEAVKQVMAPILEFIKSNI